MIGASRIEKRKGIAHLFQEAIGDARDRPVWAQKHIRDIPLVDIVSRVDRGC